MYVYKFDFFVLLKLCCWVQSEEKVWDDNFFDVFTQSVHASTVISCFE